MDVVTERNFDTVFPAAVRERYWTELDRVLVEILQVPAVDAREVVGAYRESLETAPAREQILAYHDGTLMVADELAGKTEINPAMLVQYARLIDPNMPAQRGLPD
jgi:hypothetical protein